MSKQTKILDKRIKPFYIRDKKLRDSLEEWFRNECTKEMLISLAKDLSALSGPVEPIPLMAVEYMPRTNPTQNN